MKVEKSDMVDSLIVQKKNKMTFNHPEKHFIEVHAMISKKKRRQL